MEKESLQVSPDREIVTTRIVNAPQELVFRAWTEPDRLERWWGPEGFTSTTEEYDLRPGGKWRFVMHGPDNGNYPNESVFLVVDQPAFLAWDRLSKPLFKVAATFDRLTDDTTNVTFRMLFDTKEECDKIRSFAPEKNEENFDKLEVELAGMR